MTFLSLSFFSAQMNAFDKNANINFICMTLLVIVCKSNARLLKKKQVPCIFLLDTIIGVRTYSDLAGIDPLARKNYTMPSVSVETER